jgi:hypothetical protein
MNSAAMTSVNDVMVVWTPVMAVWTPVIVVRDGADGDVHVGGGVARDELGRRQGKDLHRPPPAELS